VTPSQALTSLHGPLAEQGIRTAGSPARCHMTSNPLMAAAVSASRA